MASESIEPIPFNRPYITGNELGYIANAHSGGKLAGDGPYTHLCHQYLESECGAGRALLTHSCTAAIEISALLLDLGPGDEIIMPSYTFVSTANAFALRGATPVFVDVRSDTLNLDETKIESAINERTRAIVPVHYAGVSCAMDEIIAVARSHGLAVIEDAAQGMMARYKGKMLGTLGSIGAYSFHETKNIIAGEGGALLVNEAAMAERAEIIREKGTDRSRFFRGQVDKYTWQDVGSSYLPGELVAAFLWAQMQEAVRITQARLSIWHEYHDRLENLEYEGLLRRPIVPPECAQNAHMYYILVPRTDQRDFIIQSLRAKGINAVFHYVPLHTSPAGRKLGRLADHCDVTESISERLIRLPLWVGMTTSQVDRVVGAVNESVRS